MSDFARLGRRLEATPHRLSIVRSSGALEPSAYRELTARACSSPARAAWLGFVDRAVLGMGLALLLAGTIHFIAFDWPTLGGGLNDTYSWQILAAWTVVALPLAAAARFWPLWAFAMLLSNLTAWQLWDAPLESIGIGAEAVLYYGRLLSVATVNFVWLQAWERRGAEMSSRLRPPGRWLPRICGLLVMVALVIGTLRWISAGFEHPGAMLEPNQLVGLATAVIWLAASLTALAYYRNRRRDLAAVTAIVVGAVIVFTAALSRLLLGVPFAPSGELATTMHFMLLTAFVIAQIIGAIQWLRRERKRPTARHS